MTVIAGACARRPSVELPPTLRENLKRHLSRHVDEAVLEFSGGGYCLIKFDIGAFGAPAALRDANDQISLLAGEPLLSPELGATRAQDLAVLHDAWSRNEFANLADCRGTFCAAHFDPRNWTLSLVNDRVGVRPIYYWVGEQFVVFSSALRVLEALPEVTKQLDLLGAAEIACFGVPLADRTAYSEVRTLNAGELVQFTPNETVKRSFWYQLKPTIEGWDQQQFSKQLFGAFVSGIHRRLGNDRSTCAFLSGGLDSRSIVGALRYLDARVLTANFAPDNTQDQVFGALAAQALGTQHSALEVSVEFMGSGYGKSAVRQWLERLTQSREVERPKLIWSGDGGSVGLGHVYLTPAVVASTKSQDARGVARAFLQGAGLGIPRRILAGSLRGGLDAAVLESVVAELMKPQDVAWERRPYLYLMLNDQRRHLFRHFEEIDVDRIEFQLPFFDTQFVGLLMQAPLEPFLRHAFYVDWLKNFPPAVTAIPWQAYRGHVPCPVPAPTGLRYQWDDFFDQAAERERQRLLAREVEDYLRGNEFPGDLLSRGTLRVATWVTRMGFKNLDYWLRPAGVFLRHWRNCSSPRRIVGALPHR